MHLVKYGVFVYNLNDTIHRAFVYNFKDTVFMTLLEQLIDKYLAAANDDEKAEIISADFDFLSDNNKWDFLLTLIENSEAYDLVKVNVYKILEIADLTSLDITDIKSRILQALKVETDDMVKEYGFNALTWNFSSFPDVIDYCMDTVANEEEDENIRHCAFGVLTKSKDLQKINSLRDKLLQIKGFAKYATTFFKDRDNGIR